MADETGIILKGISGIYSVYTRGTVCECTLRGKLRLGEERPLAGDRVEYDYIGDGRGVIEAVLPRSSVFSRPPVANIGQLIIVASAAPPQTDLFLIDRVAATGGCKGVSVVICINKTDVDTGDKMYRIYSTAGYRVLRVSALTGGGLPELRALLSNNISALTGNSGVGKSSVLNALFPEMTLEVGEISERIGRGKHTTRHVEIHALPEDTLVADTPGFSAFDAGEAERELLKDPSTGFVEFARYDGLCRFTGCTHAKDAGCAVREGAERGEIAPSRYESYLKLYAQAKNYREWEHR